LGECSGSYAIIKYEGVGRAIDIPIQKDLQDFCPAVFLRRLDSLHVHSDLKEARKFPATANETAFLLVVVPKDLPGQCALLS